MSDTAFGGVAEWSKADDLKSSVGSPTRGSNPFSSAKQGFPLDYCATTTAGQKRVFLVPASFETMPYWA